MARKPNLSTETIRREIAADDAARRERSNTKRRERAAAAKAAKQAEHDKAEAESQARLAAKDRTAEREAVVEAQFVDFKAEGHTEAESRWKLTPEEVIAFIAYMGENGFDALGQPKPVDDEPPAPAPKTSKAQYFGPMLALRSAAKTYVKGTNGNPHCNDPVAALLAGVSREATVLALGSLLFVKGVTTSVNPYSKLNPGQQSMNLRNKLRGAMKNGFVTLEDIKQALVTHAPKA